MPWSGRRRRLEERDQRTEATRDASSETCALTGNALNSDRICSSAGGASDLAIDITMDAPWQNNRSITLSRRPALQ